MTISTISKSVYSLLLRYGFNFKVSMGGENN